MKIVVFIYNGFSEYEIALACQLLSGKGEIITASVDKEFVTGEAKFKIIPDYHLSELEPADFDVIIISGSPDFSPYVNCDELFEFLRKMNEKNKIISAICGGPFFIAKAGVLKGRKYTCNLPEEARETMDIFKNTTYLDRTVVVDENIITAQGFATVDFAAALGDKAGVFSSQEHKRYFERFWKEGKL